MVSKKNSRLCGRSPTWSFCLLLIGSHWGVAKYMANVTLWLSKSWFATVKIREGLFLESSQRKRLLQLSDIHANYIRSRCVHIPCLLRRAGECIWCPSPRCLVMTSLSVYYGTRQAIQQLRYITLWGAWVSRPIHKLIYSHSSYDLSQFSGFGAAWT